MKIVLGLIFIIVFMSCTKSMNVIEKDLRDNITGEWVLKNKFLGDVIDSPCGYMTKLSRDITMKIVKNNDRYDFNGQSTVNLYNGSFTIDSVDSDLKIGFMKVSVIGSTKMAGPPELMVCETYLFDFLNQAPEIRLDESGFLHIGTFKKDNVPSRNGGTYFIYERLRK